MKHRRIGRTDIHVQPLAFGGNVFNWTANESTSFQLLDAFVAENFNLIDTADVYSRWAEGHQGGESETVIGKWLKRSGSRDKVVIATKVGMDMGEGKTGLSAKYIHQACERSLNRLGINSIDLYQAHKDDLNIPLEETLGAFAELIAAGKVRAIGASNYSSARLTEALQVSAKNNWPRYECLQPHYNLVERDEFERDLAPICLHEEIGVIPYFSLAAGFLTGKYRGRDHDKSGARYARVQNYLNPRGDRVLETLDSIAAEQHATCAQVALAWLAGRPAVTAPIASATSLDQFAELIAFTRLELTAAQIDRLNAASAGQE